jgi:hypothetical protein
MVSVEDVMLGSIFLYTAHTVQFMKYVSRITEEKNNKNLLVKQ